MENSVVGISDELCLLRALLGNLHVRRDGLSFHFSRFTLIYITVQTCERHTLDEICLVRALIGNLRVRSCGLSCRLKALSFIVQSYQGHTLHEICPV